MPAFVTDVGRIQRFADLSRLSRDSIESQRAVKRLTFAGIRLVGVSDSVDIGRKSHKADVGLRGLMSELYLDDLAQKTHRGLTGHALAGASAGGLAYGYRITSTGQREIDEAQAAVVRRIFADYIAGASPRTIADRLSSEGIPSPRGSTWAMSAIRADKRGIGVLANALYIGRQIWNRSQWVKHPETGCRIRKERPESEWIITEHPELAIIDGATWEAAQRRAYAMGTERFGSRPGGPGRIPRTLFSAACYGANAAAARSWLWTAITTVATSTRIAAIVRAPVDCLCHELLWKPAC